MYTPAQTEQQKQKKINPRARKRVFTGLITAASTETVKQRGKVATARVATVEWTEAGGGLEAGDKDEEVLEAELYGQMKEKDGWYVHAPDPELEALAQQLTAVQQLMQIAIEKDILCMDPKSELGTV